MKDKNKASSNQETEIEQQLKHTLAYGIDGLGVAPTTEKNLENEDIEADKNNLRE